MLRGYLGGTLWVLRGYSGGTWGYSVGYLGCSHAGTAFFSLFFTCVFFLLFFSRTWRWLGMCDVRVRVRVRVRVSVRLLARYVTAQCYRALSARTPF